MRSLRPAATWLTAPPVCSAAHCHGCVVPHSAEAVPGQVVPAFLAYAGRQPLASSSLRFEKLSSQSMDWFWLPPATRRETIGSLTLEAFPRFPWTPIFTTRLWVHCVWTALQRSNELAQKPPFSQIWASLIGPDRDPALNVRCTVPKVSLHLFPLV